MTAAPLNIYSGSDDELGRLLSNFAPTPFVLDGIEYASVEGFYSSLFWPEDTTQRQFVRTLVGARARMTRPEPQPEVLTYRGRSFGHHSPEHVAVVERAIRAKLAAHPTLAAELAATGGRQIVHVIRGVPRDAALCATLTRIRAQLTGTPINERVEGTRTIAAMTKAEITLVAVDSGALAVTHRPGRGAVAAWGQGGVSHVVTLLHAGEGAEGIGDAVHKAGIAWVWLPVRGAAIPDEPTTQVLAAGLANVRDEITQGARVVVHCSAGIHRTGMIAYALLRMIGVGADAAVTMLDQSRPVTAAGLEPARTAWAEAVAIRVQPR